MFKAPDEIDLGFLRISLLRAGELALKKRGQVTAESKPDLSPVTVADHQVEDFLIERIRKRYPSHQVLSEESGLHQAGNSFSWIIDPIDGTRSFASGLPIWGVSIGVFRAEEPYAGGLYLPVTREMYWGTRQEGFYNNQRLPVLNQVDPNSLLVFLAVPSDGHLHYSITYPRIRSLGSTAAHLAYVATGAAVGVLLDRIGLWDIAGLLPVLSAVGVEIATLAGKPFRPADLLDGHMLNEPLLIAQPGLMKMLREQIKLR